jgi:hypothetical protein
MQNSNNNFYDIQHIVPEYIRNIKFSSGTMQEMMNVMASCNTLEEIEAKFDEIIIGNTFLESL